MLSFSCVYSYNTSVYFYSIEEHYSRAKSIRRVALIKIRNAALSDVENLTVLKQQVWIATYAIEGIRKEFSDYVLSEFTIEKTRKAILDTNLITLIAELDNHLIGCIEIKFSAVDIIPQVKGFPEITVLYVLERFCGVGVGTKLLQKAVSQIKNFDFPAAWLSVYYKNERALSFYRKNNFDIIGSTYFEMQGNQYENKVLVCALNATTHKNDY